ncbi:MAG: CCA tRNA nucleotidyltransferase [Clostridia bacterium]|nr:CCA tRNA nucleotidyltransferase [Clostridia bacterium]
MRIEPSASLARLGQAASERGAVIYNVGGAVRDRLLGFEAADDDLAGPKQPQELARLHLPGTTVLDPVNGLGTALIHCRQGEEKEVYEYTAFRTDSYGRDGRHLPEDVCFTDDITMDARRRDFTVNALYVRLPDGEVLDPTGMGLADLKAHVLRMTRPDTLTEDALRILRLIRFAAALGFEVEPETLRAARDQAPALRDISWERIQAEFFRILLGDTVYGRREAVADALYMMRDLGVLEYVLPELTEGRGFAQSPEYHCYDVLDHQIETCAAAPPELTVRLAALLHDISKPEAYRRDGNMHAHPELGSERARQVLRRLRAPRQLISDVAELVEHHMFDLTNEAKSKAVIRRINALGREQFERLADLREADFAGSGRQQKALSAEKWRKVLAGLEKDNVPLTVSGLAVSGHDLMRELHIKPGPVLGEILGQLLEHVQLRPSQNNYKSLIKYAKMIAAGSAGADRSASETS